MPLGVVTQGLFLWVSVAVKLSVVAPNNRNMVYIWFTLFRFYKLIYLIIKYLKKYWVYIDAADKPLTLTRA